MNKNGNIIIIGPCGAGKSTIAKGLATAVEMPHIDMDKLRETIYPKIGYSEEKAMLAEKEQGLMGWYEYQKPFELESVKILLKENDNAVISFGGGQSVYSDTTQENELIKLFKKEKFVFLLLPCEDTEKSLSILDERLTSKEEKILNRIFIESKTNKKVAKFIIYTQEKTPDDIINNILNIYNAN